METLVQPLPQSKELIPQQYRMPAEWEPHAGVWLTWPRPDGISFPGKYEKIPFIYAKFIQDLLKSEEVHINVWNEKEGQDVQDTLACHGVASEKLFFHPFPAYEPWCRDHGPIFVVKDMDAHCHRAVLDWDYNAWGGKYPPFDLDDEVPIHVAHYRSLPLFQPKMILEGGAIDVNGCGTLLTTRSCLLNPNRNPYLSQAQIEAKLKKYLGVRHILWLEEGIIGDDTDGHIDDITRFVSVDTVVTAVEKNKEDGNYEILQRNLELLKNMQDQDGNPLKVVELPMPDPVYHEGERMPASYANFYIANHAVIVPTYRCNQDAKALETLQSCFPGREVVGIDSIDLIWGLGSFHCISQQEPLGW
ncbi:MAG: agmatine deiminase family protein [Verrucomicrobiota bacterium]|nr:agmatine deiminase family protein [Verrucomicrobiota bacterium]